MNKAGLLGAACVIALLALSARALANRLDGIEEKVDARNHLASGHANYLPGAACVISTTAEQTPADIINYARACAKAHEDWLKEQP
tara:strand:+ start:363 stop:620 length:258 start_codon:yes stop_codon:yes gene_type:complete